MVDFRQTDAYRIVWLVRRLFRAMADTASDYLAEVGVTAAERAVIEFLYPEQRLTVPDIARRYQVSRQHVQVTVNQLLERGLAAAQENPAHQRSPLIVLTPKGRRLFAEIAALDRTAVRAVFAGISAAEQARTRRTLEKLLNRLSPEGEKT